jgi:hypothetical protein
MAKRVSNAIAATAHGTEEDDVELATAVPHRWQYLAPGVSGASHALQLALPTGDPQLGQYRPVAAAPQRGQTDGLELGDDMVPKATHRGIGWQRKG